MSDEANQYTESDKGMEQFTQASRSQLAASNMGSHATIIKCAGLSASDEAHQYTESDKCMERFTKASGSRLSAALRIRASVQSRMVALP